ncbi:M48 family metallopeptidase [Phytoactinopolyspora limicola]|uniref:M48 metallopeptidase family protein n=1 Tax=Phytoactinopolyspora limicola TaxID=2715536 RepID=UPI003CCD1263
MDDTNDVEIRRSARRRRTVTAYREGGRIVVCVPAGFSPAEERRWIAVMVERIRTKEQRRQPSDEQLLQRARDLSRRYLDGRAAPTTVRWSAAQQSRWGSCTPSDGTIRLSERLRGTPSWVLDYVIVHELAHLLIGNHGDDFWELVGRYPRSERARGFLDGLDYAANSPGSTEE